MKMKVRIVNKLENKWMVIYPRGDKNQLDIASVRYYEIDQWALASQKEFDEEKDAAIYARKLSKTNGIPLSDRSTSKFLFLLDMEN